MTAELEAGSSLLSRDAVDLLPSDLGKDDGPMPMDLDREIGIEDFAAKPSDGPVSTNLLESADGGAPSSLFPVDDTLSLIHI